MKLVSFFAAILATAGCAHIDKLDALNGKQLATVEGPLGDNADAAAEFHKLVDAVGEDAKLLHRRGTEWNTAEASFGLAVLAAAAYGGFNTVYDGGNLKDAAFAAASIGSLRSFLTPSERRNANLAAAASMTCLYEKAFVFTGPAPLGGTSSATPERLGNLSERLSSSSPLLASLVKSLDDRSREFKFDESAFPGEQPYSPKAAEAILKARLIQQRQADQLNGALLGVLSNLQTEEETYEERFALVSGVYLAIIGKLFSSTKFSAPGYEASVDALKKASEKAAASKQNTEQAKAAFAASGVGTFAALTALDEPLGKYVQARADLLACKPAD